MLAVVDVKKNDNVNGKVVSFNEVFCRNCRGSYCVKVAIPYVLRYLTNELAAMNIKLSFELKEKGNFE
jgi:DNA-directed RNA polymerase I subunit RPA2